MARSKKMVFNIAVLTTIVEATAAGSYVMVSDAESMPLVFAGYVEVNPDEATWVTDAEGAVTKPARSTLKGAAFAEAEKAAAVPAGPKVKPDFSVVGGFEPPVKPKKKSGRALYPFDQMEVGSSFFVPNKEGKDMSKSMAGAVGGYMRKMSVLSEDKPTKLYNGNEVPNMVHTVKLEVYPYSTVEGDAFVNDKVAPGTDGAVIYRRT